MRQGGGDPYGKGGARTHEDMGHAVRKWREAVAGQKRVCVLVLFGGWFMKLPGGHCMQELNAGMLGERVLSRQSEGDRTREVGVFLVGWGMKGLRRKAGAARSD